MTRKKSDTSPISFLDAMKHKKTTHAYVEQQIVSVINDDIKTEARHGRLESQGYTRVYLRHIPGLGDHYVTYDVLMDVVRSFSSNGWRIAFGFDRKKPGPFLKFLRKIFGGKGELFAIVCHPHKKIDPDSKLGEVICSMDTEKPENFKPIYYEQWNRAD